MKARLFDAEHGTVAFQCPGCECEHYLNIDIKNGRPCWGFNNNYDSPTFTPSILVRTGYYVYDDPNWRDRVTDPETQQHLIDSAIICHSYVTDGRIQFLGDCTHSKANQTIDLLDYN